MLDLEAIRARCAAATPGPWSANDTCWAWDGTDLMEVSRIKAPVQGTFWPRDAHFIAHARADIPALLAELETARALIKSLEENAVLTEERHEDEVWRLTQERDEAWCLINTFLDAAGYRGPTAALTDHLRGQSAKLQEIKAIEDRIEQAEGTVNAIARIVNPDGHEGVDIVEAVRLIEEAGAEDDATVARLGAAIRGHRYCKYGEERLTPGQRGRCGRGALCGAGRMSNPSPKCSFCAKTQDQVAKLITESGVYICDECVDLCCEILEETGSIGWVRLPEPTLRGWGAPGSDKGVKIQ